MNFVKKKIKGAALEGICLVAGVGLILVVAALPYIVKDNG